MKCTVIGAGRLGKNIALALSKSQINALFVYNQSLASSVKSCQELGTGRPIEQLEQISASDIIWICCNDDAILAIVHTLTQKSLLKPGSFVIHSSGVLTSHVLAPLKEQGCFIASFHPLKAFITGYLDVCAFNQVDCVLEGDKPVCQWITPIFSQLGAYVSEIKPENKVLYHAAACIASNYLITLAACSEELFLNAGLQAEQSRRMLVNLMQGNLNNLQQTQKITKTLTGPLVRGDIKTLALHLEALSNSEIQRLYKAAGLATIPLTKLSNELKIHLKDLLS